MTAFTALVLAGSRGPTDPLARSQGVRHRALLDVAGTPMLVRVVRALRESESVGPITVSIEDPQAVASVPELEDLRRTGALHVHRSLASPSRSVLDVLENAAPDGNLFVTTADHALLTTAMVDHFLAAAEGSQADVLVGVVARSLLHARFPDSKRTYIPLRDERYSGANLFAFRTANARRAAAFWLRAEAFRKRPWRLVSAFGPRALLLFALGRLDLDGALERASHAFGARVEAVRMPWAEAAVDVDRASDLELVRRVLSEGYSTRSPSAANPPLSGS